MEEGEEDREIGEEVQVVPGLIATVGAGPRVPRHPANEEEQHGADRGEENVPVRGQQCRRLLDDTPSRM